MRASERYSVLEFGLNLNQGCSGVETRRNGIPTIRKQQLHLKLGSSYYFRPLLGLVNSFFSKNIFFGILSGDNASEASNNCDYEQINASD